LQAEDGGTVIAKLVLLGFGLLTFAIGAADSSLLVAAIGGIVATTSSLTMVMAVISNNRTRRMELAMDVNHRKIAELEKNTDGIKEALVNATRLAGIAEGGEVERNKQSEAQANIEKGRAEGQKGV
jgi:hypothetical protein